ncbi:MAG: hypothetical protein H9777_10890 [Candidatus Phocaeicola faecigallinarum]|uniref:Uncharacterized protein n=1 Tax=Candidatus Phocaeicola faecigallinarum TaxID=2838732 RepID=A0A948TD53_9BACT|nr:hypothetical protein [Candidatus Phocaeicola faecigallinarum]
MILNGSPRAPKSNSKKYSEIFMKYSRLQCDYFNITKSNHLKLIAEMENYSDVIIVFPLYADSLPVGLLNFLKSLENNLPAQRPVISILINCGFLEYEQNSVAVSMIRYFCRRNNFPIGSALMLGSGEAILETPFRYIAVRAIKRLSESVNKGNYKDITATMPLPKWLFKMAARSYWISYGKKFGVSEKEMQRLEIES